MPMNPTVTHPLTGDTAETSDLDALARLYSANLDLLLKLRALDYNLRLAIAQLAQGEGRTRRAVGKDVIVRVETPGPDWDQATLKSLWQAGGVWAEKLLRVSQVAVNQTELNKLDQAGGTPEFIDFMAHLKSARRPASAPPRVVVET